MAKRPVYYLNSKNEIKIMEIEFHWYPGFSIIQKQKSIDDFHNNISKKLNCSKEEILEISTKSPSKIGVKLSAFNLKLKITQIENTVEAFFQSSKVFEFGGPYIDLLKRPSIQIKKDTRLKESGKIISFNLLGERWSTEPKTFFYDWLYINALHQNDDLSKKLINYKFFTDIEFNPKKSINCQARSAAFYLSLNNKNILERVISSKDLYKDLFKEDVYTQNKMF